MGETIVTFEAGTIADAMKKAGSIAPSKAGSSFDAASGIVMDISPGTESPCVIRATDTEVFFIETLDVVKCEGDAVRWRLPSVLLANVVGGQASSSGKTITFKQLSGGQIQVSSGSMRSKIFLNGNTSYPIWEPSPAVNFTMAPGFGAAVSRVMWAAERNGVALLSGFHLDGEYVIATDRYRIARYPMKIDLDEPITIPAGRLGSILNQSGDILVGRDGELFVMMTDDYTEIKTTIYGGKYPPIHSIFKTEYPQSITFSKGALTETVKKAINFAGNDRAPVLNLYLGKDQLALMMQNHEIGQYGDVIDVPGQANHDRVTIRFTPSMILDACSNSPNDTVTLYYNTAATNRPCKLDGGGGYECWLAPRSETTPTE